MVGPFTSLLDLCVFQASLWYPRLQNSTEDQGSGEQSKSWGMRLPRFHFHSVLCVLLHSGLNKARSGEDTHSKTPHGPMLPTTES